MVVDVRQVAPPWNRGPRESPASYCYHDSLRKITSANPACGELVSKNEIEKRSRCPVDGAAHSTSHIRLESGSQKTLASRPQGTSPSRDGAADFAGSARHAQNKPPACGGGGALPLTPRKPSTPRTSGQACSPGSGGRPSRRRRRSGSRPRCPRCCSPPASAPPSSSACRRCDGPGRPAPPG